jgi:hypothetical protein
MAKRSNSALRGSNGHNKRKKRSNHAKQKKVRPHSMATSMISLMTLCLISDVEQYAKKGAKKAQKQKKKAPVICFKEDTISVSLTNPTFDIPGMPNGVPMVIKDTYARLVTGTTQAIKVHPGSKGIFDRIELYDKNGVIVQQGDLIFCERHNHQAEVKAVKGKESCSLSFRCVYHELVLRPKNGGEDLKIAMVDGQGKVQHTAGYLQVTNRLDPDPDNIRPVSKVVSMEGKRLSPRPASPKTVKIEEEVFLTSRPEHPKECKSSRVLYGKENGNRQEEGLYPEGNDGPLLLALSRATGSSFGNLDFGRNTESRPRTESFVALEQNDYVDRNAFKQESRSRGESVEVDDFDMDESTTSLGDFEFDETTTESLSRTSSFTPFEQNDYVDRNALKQEFRSRGGSLEVAQTFRTNQPHGYKTFQSLHDKENGGYRQRAGSLERFDSEGCTMPLPPTEMGARSCANSFEDFDDLANRNASTQESRPRSGSLQPVSKSDIRWHFSRVALEPNDRAVSIFLN